MAIEEVPHVEEITQHLAVVRGQPLVVPSVGKDLDPDLLDRPIDDLIDQAGGVEEHRQAEQSLEVLDEVVVADVVLEVVAEKEVCWPSSSQNLGSFWSAGDESGVLAAPGPGPK